LPIARLVISVGAAAALAGCCLGLSGTSDGVQAASVSRPPGAVDAVRAAANYTAQYSLNWAGYAQTVPAAAGPYTAARAYWTVPSADTSLSGDQYASDWVGIGGYTTNSSRNLVQAGTGVEVINGTAHYYAFTEILPALAKVATLTVSPGNEIEGLVEETSTNVWKLTVYDLTTGKQADRTVHYDATQTSAEAVHERTGVGSKLPTLAQTTSVTFDPGFYSTATYAPKWTPLLQAAPGATVDRIFMDTKPGSATAPHGAIIASPSVPSADDEGFTVTDGATNPPPPWGTAEEVPGIATLGGSGEVESVSCSSAGNCSAGGEYGTDTGVQAFVVGESNGLWGSAEEVPGLAALNTGEGAEVESVSCGAVGDCSAGGYYTTSPDGLQAFVVSESSGVWGSAKEVPGLAALNTGQDAVLTSLSCGAVGNCSAGGWYYGGRITGNKQAFVVSETNGTWGTAEEVPGLAALNTGENAEVDSMSCSSAGNCSAGGSYTGVALNVGVGQAFVVSESNGVWGTAEDVPGLAALNTAGNAEVDSVSCSSVGNCSAGGAYNAVASSPGNTLQQAFVVNETNGVWGSAEEIPGTAALNTAGNAGVDSVSCSSAGNCSAGGSYESIGPKYEVFVVSETNGAWGTAEEVPGLAALNINDDAQLSSVSCGAAGNCTAGGSYDSAGPGYQAFVVSETNGAWGTAEEVPGLASLNTGADADITSVSCASAGYCSAGGYYSTPGDSMEPVVAGEPST
jgi:hypothetical protein